MEETEPMDNDSKQYYVAEGLFKVAKSPSEESHLIGSKCKNCGEVVFPSQIGCPNCCSTDVEEIPLSNKGKLFTFTNVNSAVPEGYKGPVPYGIGWIELPDGVRVQSYLTESDPEKLKIGMDMMLIIDTLFQDDDGKNVIGFKFKPC